MTALGAFNFLVLQWFGVRLGASFDPLSIPGWTADRITDDQVVSFGGRWWSRYAPPRGTPVRWALLRWVWPLSGWWSAYRWIARRPKIEKRPADATSWRSLTILVEDNATPHLEAIRDRLDNRGRRRRDAARLPEAAGLEAVNRRPKRWMRRELVAQLLALGAWPFVITTTTQGRIVWWGPN